MALYFVRHGECVANLNHVFAGSRDDSPLTDLGRAQAEQAARSLDRVKIDLIITSPLQRTRDTASIIANGIGFDPAHIQVDPRIIERDMGTMTGATRANAPLDWSNVPGIESLDHVKERVLDFLRSHKHSRDNILVVSHTGVGQIIETCRLGLHVDEVPNMQLLANGQVNKLDLNWLQ